MPAAPRTIQRHNHLPFVSTNTRAPLLRWATLDKPPGWVVGKPGLHRRSQALALPFMDATTMAPILRAQDRNANALRRIRFRRRKLLSVSGAGKEYR